MQSVSLNLKHESIQATDQIYGIFDKFDVKERIQNFGNSEEINLLEEIPLNDRLFVVDLYRLYKEKQ